MNRKKENIQLNPEELKSKYGNTIVMGIDENIVSPHIKNIFTPNNSIYCETSDHIQVPFLSLLNNNLRPRLRCEAELDSSFKQVIPYVILRNGDKVFCTHRLNGGDARLAGSYSIGTGGHIDNGESIYDGMYRELREEVGLKPSDIFGYRVVGFILDNSSAVNSVHLGVVINMLVSTQDIQCLEKEKLSGEWVGYSMLKQLYDHDQLESWSMISAKNVLFGDAS